MTSWTALAVSAAVGLGVGEWSDLAPWTARKLVCWSARRRYGSTERGAIRTEELTALINERPGNMLKLVTACGYAGAATAESLRRGMSASAHQLVRAYTAQRKERRDARNLGRRLRAADRLMTRGLYALVGGQSSLFLVLAIMGLTGVIGLSAYRILLFAFTAAMMLVLALHLRTYRAFQCPVGGHLYFHPYRAEQVRGMRSEWTVWPRRIRRCARHRYLLRQQLPPLN